MSIITATEARELMKSREQQIESFIKAWQEVFNTTVTKAAQGSSSERGKSCILFEISATSQIRKDARAIRFHCMKTLTNLLVRF
jgi:hypothetical protein